MRQPGPVIARRDSITIVLIRWEEKQLKGSKIGLAVVGSGRIGTLRARLAARHPAVNFLAVSDIDPANAKKLAEKAGADFYSGSNDEIIARPEVTAVIVSTPEGEHAAPVRKALSLGKPVLVEKPITTTVAEATDLIDTARRANRILQVGHLERFNEAVKAIEGLVSEPRFVESARLAPFKLRGTDVSVVLDLMIHDLDIILSFVEAEVADIRAVGLPFWLAGGRATASRTDRATPASAATKAPVRAATSRLLPTSTLSP